MGVVLRILVIEESGDVLRTYQETKGGDYLLGITWKDDYVEEAARLNPDLVIVQAGEVEATGICRRIWGVPGLNDMAFLLLGGAGAFPEEFKNDTPGVVDYLALPVSGEAIADRVKMLMKLKTGQRIMRSRADFFSLLGHETLTPLNGIITPLEMIRAEWNRDDSEGLEIIEMALSSAVFLEQLLRRLFNLGLYQEGEKQLSCMRQDLNELVRSCQEKKSAQVEAKQVRFEEDLGPGLQVLIDRELTRDTIDILLEQAIHFSPPGGTVKIRTFKEGGFCVFAVTDGGPKTDEDLSTIFDVFAKPRLMRHADGHGIGLTLARLYVEGHGGRMEARFDEAEGTTLSFWLPLNP